MKLKITLLMLMISLGLSAQNTLLIPPTISGTNINLTLQNSTYQFYSGTNTTTMGVNGDVLGPTILLNKGDLVNFSVNNQIGETTTIHWHGMHVSPENDGGPHTTITAGTTWSPSFTVMDKAGTYWYHPHLHEKTNEHVSKGIAGMIIVKDTEEAALTLPRTYGVDDFPLVIQTKDFDANKQIVVPSNSDDVVMVNATIDPLLQVPAQVVRLRLLNGSSMRSFNIGLDGNRTFYQIASDGGLLSASNAITRIELSPGERAEILVDFSGLNGQTLFLKSYASEFPNGIYGATKPGRGNNMVLNGYDPNSLNGADFNIMQLSVVSQNASPVTTIPTTLVTVTPIPEANSDITRDLTMTPVTSGSDQLNGDFVINDVAFNINTINYTIPLGNTEIWSIYNNSAIAHPFHIHDVQFFILDRDGVAPSASEQGRKDVILVKSQETIRFITKFEDFTSDTVPYMYHCHMLYHEDRGMMGQFKVVNSALGIADEVLNKNVSVYPNPTNGKIYINAQNETIINKVEIFDVLGRSLRVLNNFKKGQTIDLQSESKGLYFLKIYSDKGATVRKILIN